MYGYAMDSRTAIVLNVHCWRKRPESESRQNEGYLLPNEWWCFFAEMCCMQRCGLLCRTAPHLLVVCGSPALASTPAAAAAACSSGSAGSTAGGATRGSLSSVRKGSYDVKSINSDGELRFPTLRLWNQTWSFAPKEHLRCLAGNVLVPAKTTVTPWWRPQLVRLQGCVRKYFSKGILSFHLWELHMCKRENILGCRFRTHPRLCPPHAVNWLLESLVNLA